MSIERPEIEQARESLGVLIAAGIMRSMLGCIM